MVGSINSVSNATLHIFLLAPHALVLVEYDQFKSLCVTFTMCACVIARACSARCSLSQRLAQHTHQHAVECLAFNAPMLTALCLGPSDGLCIQA